MSDSAAHIQIEPLGGTVAAKTAGIGMVLVAAGALIVWIVSDEALDLAFAATVYFPTLLLGTFMVGIAAYWHLRRAHWHLVADADGVTLTMRLANGRVMKREVVQADDLCGFKWIEGDFDYASGLRIEARSGKGLFVPAESFDCAALAASAVRFFPTVASAALPGEVLRSGPSKRRR